VGIWHYRRPYGIHWNIGESGQAAICLKDSFHKTDAVCIRASELRAEGYDQNKEALQAIQSKRNCLFAVVDVKNDPKAVKIFDWSYSKFAKELEKALKIATPDQLDFAQVNGGLVLKVTIITDSYQGKKFFKVMEGDNFGGPCPGIEFISAKGPTGDFTNLSDAILDQLEKCKLDECLVITPAEKIAELFSGVESPSDETPAEEVAGEEVAGDTPAGETAGWGAAETTEEAPAEEPVAEEPEPEPEPAPARPAKPTGKPLPAGRPAARPSTPPPTGKGGKPLSKAPVAAPTGKAGAGGKRFDPKAWN
jgi:hypothetical protein